MIHSLFDSKFIRLTAIDLENDAEEIAEWFTQPQESFYPALRLLVPLSEAQVRRDIIKSGRTSQDEILLAARSVEGNRLAGLIGLSQVDWPNGCTSLSFLINPSFEQDKRSIREILAQFLEFTFSELNLYRVSVTAAEFALSMLELYEHAGFVREVRRREAMFWRGRFWDVILLGLTREDWNHSLRNSGEEQR